MRAIFLLLIVLIPFEAVSQTNSISLSAREAKWLNRNGINSEGVQNWSDTSLFHLKAALQLRQRHQKFLKLGAIGLGSGLASLAVFELFWIDPLAPVGVVLTVIGTGTGIIGGSAYSNRAATELGKAIGLNSPSAELHQHVLNSSLQSTEYVWLTRAGFDIYTYQWQEAEINRLLKKAVLNQRLSNGIWKFGSLTTLVCAGAMTAAVSFGNNDLGYLFVVPAVASPLLTVVAGWFSHEKALEHLNKAAILHPLQKTK